ncbi:hypothetical protein M407DRAFT_30483 [Tulasnella calospora MUT 4182]|uniref:Uncharacterized protein n=1 Tax=Tulasnella calospora MUT 4182 TaxID=1051891 RepID=A0A0C3Q863_9AGAM|nr:hypothetical protein M407DRAFT_30483 [Tulasnella calospora MUT 4182]
MMVSSTATRGGDSFAVDVALAATTTLEAPQQLPPSGTGLVGVTTRTSSRPS